MHDVSFLSVLDFVRIATLVFAMAVKNVCAPMMIGYAITTIGGLYIVGGICVMGCVAFL